MKIHHKMCHAFQSIRAFNPVVTMIDVALCFLLNEDIDGNPLDQTLEQLQAAIQAVCNAVMSKYSQIEIFLNPFDYDLSQYTNRSKAVLLSDKAQSDSFATNLQAAVVAPSINSLDKLSKIAVSNPLEYATPILLETQYHYSIILNDWLDVSAYTLHGIDHKTGGPLNKTDEEKEAIVRGCLNQFPNLLNINYSIDLEDEIDSMVGVRDTVLTMLDGNEDLTVIGDFIDSNTEKLPLMRRLWVIG